MATYRIHKTANYTVMSNHHLRDRGLSYKAKGLMSVLLSLPDDWEHSVAGLASLSTDGKVAVKSAMDELASAGYVTVTKVYPHKGNGRISYVYDIYETPEHRDERTFEVEEPQEPEQPTLFDEPEPGQEPRLKAKAKPKAKQKPRRFVPPSPEEAEAYARSIGFELDGGRFCDYYETRGWKYKGNVAMRDWKAAVRNWKRSDQGGGKRSDEDSEWDSKHGW